MIDEHRDENEGEDEGDSENEGEDKDKRLKYQGSTVGSSIVGRLNCR